MSGDKAPAKSLLNELSQSKINIYLPNGERALRRVGGTCKKEAHLALIRTKHMVHIALDLVPVSSYSKRLYLDGQQTIQDAGLVRDASLAVEGQESEN
ncbi:hypothetical protein SmJEL517_g03989 [Synchytrium microbalum]|uniref:Uncharacterized protein n=1 Tax=Synchytrium microbalum TaxID=1806994 RepID=A0A507C1S3_9FUNG|nr:uncharacterized protein SmJEL517_g03989 [Synchytrium microbalum]TPX33009.1 hypothetical protein SmJEL517_g03989 [Synchytrium microbalum]